MSSDTASGGLSRGWIFVSLALYTAIEVGLGMWAASALRGHLYGHVTSIKLEVMLLLATYVLGAGIIGFLSPAVRVWEPAIAAFLSTVITFLIGYYTPMHFLSFSLERASIGGGLAFFAAMFGADMGERAAAMFGNRASRDYARE